MLLLICLFAACNSGIIAGASNICSGPICEYELVIRRERTMFFREKPDENGYDVGLNGTNLQVLETQFRTKATTEMLGRILSPDDVITADGYPRDVITINGEFPGPNIEVMEGVQVVVRVTNKLFLEGTTVHFHGITMRRTPWMDGTSYVSQCPIQPLQSFVYQFNAYPPGTHWYHSHFGSQRLDGLYGMITVHTRLPRIPEIPMTVSDWFHEDAISIEVQNPFTKENKGSGRLHLPADGRHFAVDNNQLSSLQYVSALINGRGRWDELQPFPLAQFQVAVGLRYRFRLAHSGGEFSFEILIDDHEMTVVALDGSEIQPVLVSSFLIHPGETLDFELKADQLPGRYWVRSRSMRQGPSIFPSPDGVVHEAKAILVYAESTLDAVDPETNSRVCTQEVPCRVLNCPFGNYPASHNKTCVSIADVRSVIPQETLDALYGLKDDGEDVEQYFFNFAFSPGSSINARKFMDPGAPFSEPKAQVLVHCDTETCDKDGCRCTHVQKLPFNKTVQFVLLDYTPDNVYMSHHPAHLHGHNFAVLAQGFAQQDPLTGYWSAENDDVMCGDEYKTYCTRARWRSGQPSSLNMRQPPVKDTVLIPARGYVVVRFRTDNPGFWMFHCHIEMHTVDGMVMVFEEAPGRIPRTPDNFPRCSTFNSSVDEYSRRLAGDYATSPPTTMAAPEVSTTTTPEATNGCPKSTDKEDTISTKEDEENQNTGSRKSNVLEVSLETAVGLAFAFIATGAILAIIPMFIYACCVSRQTKYTM